MPNDTSAGRLENSAEFLAGGGEMGAVIRSIDWSRTPLGPPDTWSQALRTTVGLLLRNRFPLLLWWGPRHIQLYNDAYRPIPGQKHPQSMGQPASECWKEVWHIIGPMIEAPYSGEPATASDDLDVLINRRGFLEEAHFKVAYSPVPDETVPGTGVGGVLATVAETTAQVFAERQLKTLRELGARAGREQTPEAACAAAAATFAENPQDIPFALLYLVQPDGTRATLSASVGFAADADGRATPRELDLRAPAAASVWPIGRAVATQAVEFVPDLTRLDHVPRGSWSHAPRAAMVLPLASPDQERPYGVLVAGLSPHRELDEGYRTFFDLAATQIVTAIRNARALEEQRLRAEQLAEIDRAKTLFFSNVSHEFRTPLTLMIGPIEDALASATRALSGDNLETAYRNALRLLKLVNALLDFSRIEAGRVRARYEATDLAVATSELAGVFRSAIERAGLRFTVTAEPLPHPVYLDREMWEKVVLNLLSNALKFTFSGEITVLVRPAGNAAELVVADTGAGIAEHELPRLFERFHRIEGVRARTNEGSGIGLALVQELVRLHGGEIRATSTPGRGTTFVVTVRYGTDHLPAEQLAHRPVQRPRTSGPSAAFTEEALRWLSDSTVSVEAHPDTVGATILLADDNADMREYLARLLGQHWRVLAVADGQAALAEMAQREFDLVLTDVMMPMLDGFGLLGAIRADPRLRATPVIMLSARAGEESRVEGLAAGADDYLVKPFSARELIARVETHLQLGRARAALRDEQARLVASNRAKDEFLAMLGHELRNPLTPMRLALATLENRLRRGESGERQIAMLDRQIENVSRMVDDLLDVSRVTRGLIELKQECLSLAPVVRRALDAVQHVIETKGHAVSVSLPNQPVYVHGDPVRLEQVFVNLLTNAARYSDPHGRITVTLAPVAPGSIELRVRDTGIGIEQEMLGRIFDLFEQAHRDLARSQGGLGVGLTIAKKLVELHGGTLEARSEGAGRGSEFVVTLPVVAPAPVSEGLEPTSGDQDDVVALHVLVVDDNADVADTIAEFLEGDGYRVSTARDGHAALRELELGVPDVILLDIGLPGMDGYQVARRMRSGAAARAFIVAVTGYGQRKDREAALESGFDAHLVKPVNLDTLRSLLGEVARRRTAADPV